MQRKVFRIEETMMSRGERRRTSNARATEPTAPDDLTRHKRDLAAIIHDGDQRRMTLAASELGAAIEAMEKATQDILRLAESVDARARAQTDTTRNAHESALARDIQERMAQIYEACNFQDIAGQRISKVIDVLATVDTQLAAMAAHGGVTHTAKREDSLVNGPRLDGASGHVTQHDIDALFG